MQRLFSVLIVDDEPWVLDGLRDYIPWEEYGFKVCGCAADGAKALLEVERLMPDLVMTDINMPGVNGLQFMAQCRKTTGKDILFLVLSGYNRFEYMTEAMTYGIIDYLLKPLYPQDVVPALIKAATQLRKMELEAINQKREQAEQCQNDFNMLTCLEHVDYDTRARFCMYMGIDQDDPVMPLLLTRKNANEQAMYLKKHDTELILESLSTCFSLPPNQTVFLIDPIHIAVLIVGFQEEMERKAYKVLREIKKGEDDYRIAIGVQCTVHHGLPASFHQARLFQLLSEDSIIICREAENNQESAVEFSKMEAVLSSFHHEDEKKMEAACHALLQDCKKRRESRRHFMNCVRVLTGEIEIILAEAGAGDVQQDFAWANQSMNLPLDELEKQMINYLKEKLILLQNKNLTDGERIQAEIQRYVPHHLQEPLTIGYLADMFHLNPVYLGKIVKKNTGNSLATFVCQCRIAEAKRLLKNTNLSVLQISKQVGFQDASYFAKKFKEQEQILPTEYRGD